MIFVCFAIQGPKATAAVTKMENVELGAVKYYHFVKGEFAGVTNVILSNMGYTGAGGVEIYLR